MPHVCFSVVASRRPSWLQLSDPAYLTRYDWLVFTVDHWLGERSQQVPLIGWVINRDMCPNSRLLERGLTWFNSHRQTSIYTEFKPALPHHILIKNYPTGFGSTLSGDFFPNSITTGLTTRIWPGLLVQKYLHINCVNSVTIRITNHDLCWGWVCVYVLK